MPSLNPFTGNSSIDWDESLGGRRPSDVQVVLKTTEQNPITTANYTKSNIPITTTDTKNTTSKPAVVTIFTTKNIVLACLLGLGIIIGGIWYYNNN